MSPRLTVVITRHVTSETTYGYWLEACRCLRQWYPKEAITIIVVDDSSKYPDDATLRVRDAVYTTDLEVTIYYDREHPGRAELLGLYYLHEKATTPYGAFLHDACFLQSRNVLFDDILQAPEGEPSVAFARLQRLGFQFLWTATLAYNLRDEQQALLYFFPHREDLLALYNTEEWRVCVGCQSVVSLDFLRRVNTTFDFFERLKPRVTYREARAHLERLWPIMAMTQSRYDTGVAVQKDEVTWLGDFYQIYGQERSYSDYLAMKAAGICDMIFFKVCTGR